MKNPTVNEMVKMITDKLSDVFRVTHEEATEEHFYKACALIARD